VKTFIRCAAALIAAALLTGVLASIFSTQFVISGLESIDVNIPINDRLTMTLKDLAILKLLVLIVAICFTVGFLVAAFFNGRLGLVYSGWSLCICLHIIIDEYANAVNPRRWCQNLFWLVYTRAGRCMRRVAVCTPYARAGG